ncbi:hypothetical protein BZA05DRAFT_382658 [Tricharina praecox]|uniref:uncharacterized protein n=1 Tax=Tricharina praecox TaxID=43433 RepID=UPI00222093D4|nr:uncharacterized protein BZA05DRAFT_382658 [Tricharina praecox]KAI5858871.1 hypothetical protein BZA05DRAFT_382658 [Tricharina praecox]
MAVTVLDASRSRPATLVSRLSASTLAATALQQIPSNYLSLAKSLLAIAANNIPLLSAPTPLPEAEEVFTLDAPDYFKSRQAPQENDLSSNTLPPPSYATSPPTPTQPTEPTSPSQTVHFSHPSSLSQVVSQASSSSTGRCPSCSQLQLQLHLLTLQNEAYLAQRDYLLQHQQSPGCTAASPGSQGLLALVIANAIRALFLVAFLLWPYVVRLSWKAREWENEWEIGGRVRTWGWRCVGMAWTVVASAGKERHIGVGRRAQAEWEVWAMRGMEEVVSGVGQGVREGLGLWGVRVEGTM